MTELDNISGSAPERDQGVTVEISLSPAGKRCVEMTAGDRKWILVDAYTDRGAFDQGLYFHQINMEVKRGVAYSWRDSIAKNELVILEPDKPGQKLVGLYIPSEKFDEFIDYAMRGYPGSSVSTEG